jgi:hypothetical protein
MVSSGLLRRVALVRTTRVTTQKTFFIVTAVKTSNLTYFKIVLYIYCKLICIRKISFCLAGDNEV